MAGGGEQRRQCPTFVLLNTSQKHSSLIEAASPYSAIFKRSTLRSRCHAYNAELSAHHETISGLRTDLQTLQSAEDCRMSKEES